MSGDGVARSAAPEDVIQRYETLRTAVLDDGLDLESRNGLALFLRRGMWGWAQAATTPIASPQRARSSVARSNVEDEHQVIVHLLAALATRSSNRRAYERVS
jgi:hypothetical protein